MRFCVPILDAIATELDDRFGGLCERPIKLLKLTTSIFLKGSNENHKQLVEAINFYSESLPNSKAIERELVTYKITLQNKSKSGDSEPDSQIGGLKLLHSNRHTFPNLLRMSQIALVLPVTSCEAERSFSCLRRLYTWLRHNMKEARISNLARMNVHRTRLLSIDSARIVNEFLKMHPRTLEFKIIKGQIAERYKFNLLLYALHTLSTLFVCHLKGTLHLRSTLAQQIVLTSLNNKFVLGI